MGKIHPKYLNTLPKKQKLEAAFKQKHWLNSRTLLSKSQPKRWNFLLDLVCKFKNQNVSLRGHHMPEFVPRAGLGEPSGLHWDPLPAPTGNLSAKQLTAKAKSSLGRSSIFCFIVCSRETHLPESRHLSTSAATALNGSTLLASAQCKKSPGKPGILQQEQGIKNCLPLSCSERFQRKPSNHMMP